MPLRIGDVVDVNRITQHVIGAAIEVHRVLGLDLLEEAYQKALERKLQLQQIPFESQKQLAITYKGMTLLSTKLSDRFAG
jgi:GxxExxY protein